MKKILFIEDEASLQKTLGDALKEAGYETVSALDGESGIRLARTEKIDLILLDIILPRKQGLEVLKELKTDKLTKDIPVIILTNIEEMENVDKALELGAMTYLVKTQYTLEDLIEKIKKTLEG